MKKIIEFFSSSYTLLIIMCIVLVACLFGENYLVKKESNNAASNYRWIIHKDSINNYDTDRFDDYTYYFENKGWNGFLDTEFYLRVDKVTKCQYIYVNQYSMVALKDKNGNMYKDDFDEKTDKLRFNVDRYNDVIVIRDTKTGRSYTFGSKVEVITELEE